MIHTRYARKKNSSFADVRLGVRYEKIMGRLEEGQSSIMNKIHMSRDERKGSYGFFKNGRVKEAHLKGQIYKRLSESREQVEGEHILVPGDTTEYNYKPG